MCKGSKSTTTSSTYNPAASGYYSDILNRAQGVAATPYQAYSGELVAPINAQQNLGIGNINQYAGFGLPYYQQAGDLVTDASKPISSADISQYMNPYTQNVVDKTLAAYDTYNKQQQNNVVGNAAAQHALGGNRVGTAQANLAALQGVTQAPQIAKLYSDAYTSGLGTALSQQQNKLAAAYGLGSIGGGGQNTALAGANAQIGAGNLQQGTQQALDTARYNQFLQQQAYPFQTAQWQAGITGALGPSMGGTQTGVTTQPQPSLFSQIAGLGMAGVGAASGLGWRPFAASGGRINGYADGGLPEGGMSAMPYAGGKSWIPAISLQPGRVPSLQTPQIPQYPDEAQNMMRSGLSMMGRGSGMGGTGSGVGAVDFDPADTFVYDMPEEAGMFSGLGDSIGGAFSGLGEGISGALGGIGEGIAGGLGSVAEFLPFLLLARGGKVPGYQDAGAVPFDDRFGDLTPSIDMTGQGVDPRNLGAILRHAEGLNSYNLMPNEQTPLLARSVPTERYAMDHVPLPQPRPQVAGMGPLPSLITRGTSNPNVQLDDEGVGALGYDEAPRTTGVAPVISPTYSPNYRQEVPAGRGFLGLSGVPNDEASMALIATGLGMAASRSPYPLAALGEGGLQGLQTLRQVRSDKLAAQRLDEVARQHLERMNLDRARLLQAEKHQTATESEMKRYHDMIDAIRKQTGQMPRKLYQNEKGVDIYGIPDPTAPGGYRMIDPKTGIPRDLDAPPVARPDVSDKTTPDLSKGVLEAHAELLKAGPYDYSEDAPHIEKGMEVPEPEAVGGKSAAALKTSAEQYLQTGKLPTARGMRGPVAAQTQAYRNAVENYANALAQSRGISPQQLPEIWRTAPGLLRFVLGPAGQPTIALGTTIRHLDTVAEYAKAWQANDIAAINRARAVLSREFGGNAATNLETVARIVGPEIIKAIGVAGAGTEAEREVGTWAFGPARSPAQIFGSILATQKLLAGQLEGRRRQAASAGVSEERFKNLIGDRPYEILTGLGKSEGKGAAPELTPQQQQALDWAIKNPNDPRAAEIKRRLGVQ